MSALVLAGRIAVLVNVLDVGAGAGAPTVVDIEAPAREALALAPDLEVLSRREVAERRLESVLASCGNDVPCLRREAQAAGLSAALLLLASGDPALLSVRLIVIDDESKSFRALMELPPRRSALTALVFERVTEVLAEADARGRGVVEVDVEPGDATVAVEGGIPSTARRDRVFVEPGSVVVRVERDGFEGETRAVDVAPFSTVRVRVTLDRSTSVFASPWFWVAAGVVVAGATVGTVVALQPRGIAVCRPVAGDDCM